MTLQERLAILADGAKYDASCSSSGSSREGTHTSGICHSWTSDGRCVSLLKILMTNVCLYDCAYCFSRASNDIVRTSLSPEEIATLTIGFYRRNMIEGLFLSSGIVKSPNHTMELLLRTVSLLRHTYHFDGYIHLKAIPGCDENLIEHVGFLVDRLSVNIELPTAESLALLAPQKSKASILAPMKKIATTLTDHTLQRQMLPLAHRKTVPSFVPAGQSTQMIIGASPENDRTLLGLSDALYRTLGLKRVYYSAYIPINTDPKLPVIATPPLLREHRLYQADWLIRFYGFGVDEILDTTTPNFDPRFDPKMGWALRHPDLFPIELSRASYEMILRIPGIGLRSAAKIVKTRRYRRLSFEGLHHLGVSLKRAKHFITINGAYLDTIDNALQGLKSPTKRHHPTLFDEGVNSAISGQL